MFVNDIVDFCRVIRQLLLICNFDIGNQVYRHAYSPLWIGSLGERINQNESGLQQTICHNVAYTRGVKKANVLTTA